eukprot:scaffold7377_cov389-Prasinococcus_capsulatus_cf.AAC.35
MSWHLVDLGRNQLDPFALDRAASRSAIGRRLQSIPPQNCLLLHAPPPRILQGSACGICPRAARCRWSRVFPVEFPGGVEQVVDVVPRSPVAPWPASASGK